MKKGYSLLQVIIVIVITSIVSGITVGVIFSNGIGNDEVNYSSLLKDENIKDFLNSYLEIINDYYEDIDKEELIKNAIDGMVGYLDESYTSYLSDTEASVLMNSLNSKYNGIGIIVSGNKVISILNESPACKAGILENDIITKVNDTYITEKDTENITTLIKENNNVYLEINRNGENLTFNLSSEELSVPNVSYYVVDNTSIGYIDIDVFSANVANEVQNALNRLNNLNINSLIIDLRANAGGYLEQAYLTAEYFLKKGDIVYCLETKGKKETYKDKTTEKYDKPIVVLVDGDTASASEILAAALKDSYGATIVGVKSFGKGKVQHTYNLTNGSLFKYTSSKWLRPSGDCIDGIGITPDYIIENSVLEETSTEDNFVDNQLNKAIELLSK